MRHRLILFVLLTGVIASSISLRENDFCQTPNRYTGRCIKLFQCPEVLSLLQNKYRTQYDVSYARASHCGVFRNEPYVCCLSNNIDDDSNDIITFKEENDNFENKRSKQLDSLRLDDVLPSDCGKQISNRVVGGVATDLDEFPWLALLEYNTPNGSTTACGGALIHKRYVLTAAHCLIGKDLPFSWKLQNVRLGEWNTSSSPDCVPFGSSVCAQEHMTIPVEMQIINEGFKPCNTHLCSSSNEYNDIALLRLSQDVPFTDFVKPICLPKTDRLGSKAWVAGWGTTEHSSSSEIKLKVELPIVQNEPCQRVYEKMSVELVPTQICAGGQKGKDSCRGDSGGPLMRENQENQGRWEAVGVTSFGPSPCGKPDHPGVYTNVYSFMPWIINNIRGPIQQN